jgi:UDP-N-acetylmuramoyl-L-alanyl-D-glutamate--2,6-diaminopimelate ligase
MLLQQLLQELPHQQLFGELLRIQSTTTTTSDFWDDLLRRYPALDAAQLDELWRHLGVSEIEVKRVRYDTRAIEPGDVFVALRGSKVDGHTLFAAAIQKGAAAVIGEDEAPLQEAAKLGAVAIQVRSCRSALAQTACILNGHPSKKLVMLGVTGTNGKTTTTYLTEAVLRQLGVSVGVIGTVEYRVGDHRWPAAFTTPEAPELQETLAKMVALGATHVVMEVSSHGLASERVGGIQFHSAAFTNLTQDHLDFHHTMEEYFAAKAKLFAPPYLRDGGAVINIDDEHGRSLASVIIGQAITFSIDASAEADIRPVTAPVYSLAGISARIKTPHGEFDLKSPLVGPHNLANLFTAFGFALRLGFSSQQIVDAFVKADGAPGRLERVRGSAGFDVFVDYAHSPDALERVLLAMRPLTPGRLIAVFGCGGDRDKKRPIMGEVVGRLADIGVVTSDNPRTEDPASILEMIVPGVEQGGMAREAGQRGYWVEVDRRRAIALAVSLAKPRDAILLFGKGHEDYQIIGTTKTHFDDREEARNALRT